MEKRGLNIYFIHSTKSDYNNLIYLPVLRSKVLAKHNLVLPLSEENKERYYKDIMDEADVFVIELSEPDSGFDMQLKYAIMSKKPILALALKSKGFDSKYQQLLKNVIGYSKEEEFRYFVETFADNYKDKVRMGKVDPTLILGVLN